MKKVFICGGDLRLKYMADYLRARGSLVHLFGHGISGEALENIKDCDALVFGLPAIKDGKVYMPYSNDELSFGEVISHLDKNALVFGGALKKDSIDEASGLGIKCIDYLNDEVFQVENALYTAEGALCEIIENTDSSLRDMRLLVIGGGRIAKAFCTLILGVPCNAQVYARSEIQRAFFETLGYKTLSELKSFGDYDVIINTVPAHIFPEKLMATVRTGALFTDLSERPGYVPKDICASYGIRLMYLPGIPSKSAPRSAGISAAKAVWRLYREAKNTEGI